MRANRRTRRGVALMDALIGGIILGVGVAVVLSTSSHAISRQNDAEQQITASWLADELLTMLLVEGPDEYKRRFDLAGRCEAPFERFEFDIDLDNPPRGYPFNVVVTVSWEAAGGRHYVQTETRIAQRLGEAIEPWEREPLERLDRDDRYFGDDDEEGADAAP